MGRRRPDRGRQFTLQRLDKTRRGLWQTIRFFLQLGLRAEKSLRLGGAQNPLRHDHQILAGRDGRAPPAGGGGMVEDIDKLRALQPLDRGGKAEQGHGDKDQRIERKAPDHCVNSGVQTVDSKQGFGAQPGHTEQPVLKGRNR